MLLLLLELLVMMIERGVELLLELLQWMHLQLMIVLMLCAGHQWQPVVIGITRGAVAAAARQIRCGCGGGGSSSRASSHSSLLQCRIAMRAGEGFAEVFACHIACLVQIVQLTGADDGRLVRVAFHEQIIG